MEQGSKQAMDALTHQVSKGALADIMSVKTKAVKLNTRVVRFKEELERILQDNEEMAEMFLTRRAHMESMLAGQEPLDTAPSTEDAAAQALAEGPPAEDPFEGGGRLERESTLDSRPSMGAGSPPSSRSFLRTSTIRRPLRSPSVTPGRGLRSVTVAADGPTGVKRAGLVLASDELGQMALVQAIGDVEDMLEV